MFVYCVHITSTSNFSWAVLALHVFVLVRHPGKVDAEQHFVGTRLDFPFSTCMNILILNYCLKYFDHFCLISLYTVQYMSLLPKNLQVTFFSPVQDCFPTTVRGKQGRRPGKSRQIWIQYLWEVANVLWNTLHPVVFSSPHWPGRKILETSWKT